MKKNNINILNMKSSIIFFILLLVFLPKIVFAVEFYNDFRLIINNNEAKTNNATVKIKLEAPVGTRMMQISNEDYFENSLMEKYANTKDWELIHKKGVNTVYVRFYDSFGDVLATVNNIIILTSPVDKNDDGMVDFSDLEMITSKRKLSNLANIGSAFSKSEAFNIFDFNQMMIDWSNLSVTKQK